MTKKQRNVMTIVWILIGILFMTSYTINRNNYKKTLHYEEVLVTRGDSLWKIGLEKCPDKMDIRDWIDDVNEHNHIDTNVYPGMKIEVLTDD